MSCLSSQFILPTSFRISHRLPISFSSSSFSSSFSSSPSPTALAVTIALQQLLAAAFLLHLHQAPTQLHSTLWWSTSQWEKVELGRALKSSAALNCSKRRGEVQIDASELCDVSPRAVHQCSASLKCIGRQCIIEVGGELHYNYCPIRTIGGEWGQEIDTSSKLHPAPSSSPGLWMLSNPIHTQKICEVKKLRNKWKL